MEELEDTHLREREGLILKSGVSYNFFLNRRFRRIVGRTPGEYRKTTLTMNGQSDLRSTGCQNSRW